MVAKKHIRRDSVGSVPSHHGTSTHTHKVAMMDSLTYAQEESDAWRAHVALEHYSHRGKFWNAGKHATFTRYLLIATLGSVRASLPISLL